MVKRSASRGKPLSLEDSPVPESRWPDRETLTLAERRETVMRFLIVANRKHKFVGTGTQCPRCWGWYDDPRHL